MPLPPISVEKRIEGVPESPGVAAPSAAIIEAELRVRAKSKVRQRLAVIRVTRCRSRLRAKFSVMGTCRPSRDNRLAVRAQVWAFIARGMTLEKAEWFASGAAFKGATRAA